MERFTQPSVPNSENPDSLSEHQLLLKNFPIADCLADPAIAREFYEAKWEQEAQAALEERAFIPADRPAEFYMQREADRDNEMFDRELHAEYLEWQKNLHVVLKSFMEAPGSLTPEGKPRKKVILMLGGGMSCALTAGQVLALDAKGINTSTVDVVVGASSGGMVATEFAVGPEGIKTGTDMLIKALSNSKFISFAGDRIYKGNMIDLQVVQELLEDPDCPYYLDQTALKQSAGSDLGFIMTEIDPDTGKAVSVIIDGKESDASITDLITASMSIPKVTGKIPLIHGKKYFDGAVVPLPIETVIRAYDPTDILVLPQAAFDPLEDINDSWLAKVGAQIAKWRKWGFLEAGLSSRQSLRNSLGKIQADTGVNIGMFWTPQVAGVNTTNINPVISQDGIVSSYYSATRELERAMSA